MSFLKKLFTPIPTNSGRFHTFQVKCKRCGEIIEGQVNLSNDPSLEHDPKGRTYYVCRKVLMGSRRCFQRIEVTLYFNERRGVIDRQITGGEFAED